MPRTSGARRWTCPHSRFSTPLMPMNERAAAFFGLCRFRCRTVLDAISRRCCTDRVSSVTKVSRDFDAELVECDGEDDHVHLLVQYPPKVALSKLVNSLKGVSSRLLREARPEVAGRYHKGVLWSPSYFAASCGGAPLSIVAEYVTSQRQAAQGRARVPPRPERWGIPRGSR